jgi:Cft2 family RNA processing exonuclease
MKLTFLGGADEVGASSTLIEIAGKRLLVDVGIRISPKSVRGISNDQLPDLQQISAIGGPDYILVTHAHTDHTGALPLVLEQYPDAPVFATEPTIALTKVLQADAQYIMKNKQEEEGELPLFDEISVARLLNAFQPVQFRQPIHLGDGLQVSYYPSGHIMGAAMLVIESEEGILVMSGDLSMTPQRAVVKAELPRIRADFLVMESTYGGRLHANRAAEERRLIETVKRVVDRGGKAIIPAFALGRAQEVIQILHAFRDQVDAPVWVDGMVRVVCSAYNTFSEYLPDRTVRAAKNDDLFFRDNIRAVKSPVQREEIAHSEGPAIIVSSSGMLTGGPSAAYVKWLAGDERNGIFLTGYQDEESPGRFVQKMVSDREEGKAVTFRVDKTSVSLRCELGTYSLSAHADESELISIAEGLHAEGVALVHGDHGARHSIAASLRERGKQVHMPVTGSSIERTFAKRPWAVGVQKGSEAKPLDPAALWETLKESAGSYYSTRELSRAWWGTDERAAEATSILETDGVYFAQDWRRTNTFQVRNAQQVARTQRQQAIMMAHPDLVNQLVVLRDINQKVRIGIVQEAGVDAFNAIVLKAKGRNYPADALVWAISNWLTMPRIEEKGLMGQMSEVYRQAEALRDTLMPFERRRQLALGSKPVNPAELVPDNLPENIHPLLAQLTIVLALANDGAEYSTEGLVPKHATAVEPMEMNLARRTALALFDENARLRKVGLDTNRNQLTLNFDFPDWAKERYEDAIQMAAEQTNWEVIVAPEVNQQALGAALYDLLPAGASLIKGPSFYMGQKMVQADIDGLDNPQALIQAYTDFTGFDLAVNSDAQPSAMTTAPAVNNAAEQLEINAAYDLIRSALERYGLYKTSLKQGRIVLSFISPQVGARHLDTITNLAQKTGYELTIHPHPNQNEILQVARNIARQAKLNIQKGPSIHVDRGEVVIKLADTTDEADIDELSQRFEHETGFQLNLTS